MSFSKLSQSGHTSESEVRNVEGREHASGSRRWFWPSQPLQPLTKVVSFTLGKYERFRRGKEKNSLQVTTAETDWLHAAGQERCFYSLESILLQGPVFGFFSGYFSPPASGTASHDNCQNNNKKNADRGSSDASMPFETSGKAVTVRKWRLKSRKDS